MVGGIEAVLKGVAVAGLSTANHFRFTTPNPRGVLREGGTVYDKRLGGDD